MCLRSNLQYSKYKPYVSVSFTRVTPNTGVRANFCARSQGEGKPGKSRASKPVILSAAKDLRRWRKRSFATLRMTGEEAALSAKGTPLWPGYSMRKITSQTARTKLPGIPSVQWFRVAPEKIHAGDVPMISCCRLMLKGSRSWAYRVWDAG
jgi:hypothetical protein